MSEAKAKTIFHYLETPKVQQGLAAVAGKYLAPDRMLRLCINAVKKTPRLMECDPQSVLGAMMASAALGLEPNTTLQQAFLIPYKRRAKVDNRWVDVYDCQFQIGARGFITLAYRSPEVKSLTASAIREGDKFEHMDGSDAFLSYSKALRERGELIGAFSFARLEGGLETACVLPIEELEKIRERSETYRALVAGVQSAENANERAKAERKLAETPWVMWIDDMSAKSAIKKHAKQLPINNGMLAAAAELDSKGDVSSLDLRAMSDPDLVRTVVEDGDEPPQIAHDPSPNFNDVAGQQPIEKREGVRAAPRSRSAKAAEQSSDQRADPQPAMSSNEPEGDPNQATEGEKRFILNKLQELGVPLEEALQAKGISNFDQLTPDGFIALRDFIAEVGRHAK